MFFDQVNKRIVVRAKIGQGSEIAGGACPNCGEELSELDKPEKCPDCGLPIVWHVDRSNQDRWLGGHGGSR